MTVGVIALDGLDWNLVERTDALSGLPDGAYAGELYNDLPGHPDHGHYRLFTPYVWTCIWTGERQEAVWGWHQPDGYTDLTDHLTFLWDKVPNSVVHNVKVHADYWHINSDLPEGWVPTYGGVDKAKKTMDILTDRWNDTLDGRQPPLFVQWWRLPDWWGHHAVDRKEPLTPAYEWIRDEFIPGLDFPENWVLVSDHGFKTDTENGTDGKGSKSRYQHRPSATLASNMDGVDYDTMTEFVESWHGDVLDAIRQSNLQEMGYVD